MSAPYASLLLGIALAVSGCGAPTPAGSAPVSATDVDGTELAVFADGPATVLVFVATACPISNRYAPEIQRIAAAYAERGVGFRLIYPDGDDTADAIRSHRDAFSLPGPALRDPDLSLARLAGVAVTPEAAVFDGGRVRRYRGRIDDRVVEFGRARPAPTRHDLAEAVEAVLRGDAVDEPERPAVGCAIPGLS